MSADVMLREMPSAPFVTPAQRDYVTLDEYYALAEACELRVEYINGRVNVMGGVLHNHGAMLMTLGWLLYEQLARKGFTLLSSNVRVRASESGLFFPDLSVARGIPRYHADRSDLLNPALVIEILSPTTRKKDLGDKLDAYRAMTSMEHIIIMEQNRAFAQHYSRAGKEWTRRTYTELDDVLALTSLDTSMSLAQIYQDADI